MSLDFRGHLLVKVVIEMPKGIFFCDTILCANKSFCRELIFYILLDFEKSFYNSIATRSYLITRSDVG